MAVTVVLRLLPGPLEAGELVGRAEIVATGEIVVLRGIADLLQLARGAVSSGTHPAALAPDAPADACAIAETD